MVLVRKLTRCKVMTNVHVLLAGSLNESTLARPCNAHHGNEDFSMMIHDNVGIPEPLSVELDFKSNKILPPRLHETFGAKLLKEHFQSIAKYERNKLMDKYRQSQ